MSLYDEFDGDERLLGPIRAPVKAARILLHPALVFCALSVGSFFLWRFTSPSFLNLYGMSEKAPDGPAAELLLYACVSFGLGALASYFVSISRMLVVRTSLGKLTRRSWWAFVISFAAFSLVVGGTVATSGFGGLMASVRGGVRTFSIPGLTSLVHVATALFPVLYLILRLRRREGAAWDSMKAEVLVSACVAALVVVRMYLMGERVALLIPLAAILISEFLLCRRYFFRLVFGITIFGCIAVFGVFAFSESQRSFAAKQELYNLDQSVWEYSSDRLLLYYVTSINSGVAEYAIRSDRDQYRVVGERTFRPFFELGSGVYRIATGLPEPQEYVYEELWASGAKLREFTNVWGIASPLMEGKVWGCIYWFGYGFFVTLMFRRICLGVGSVRSFGLYTILMTGLLESPRVLSAGEPHVIVPILALCVMGHMGRLELNNNGPRPAQRPDLLRFNRP